LKLKGQKSKEGEIQMERALNVKVDVVSDRAIREELKDEILKEAILI
jgi:predicted nucleotidyltransferase